MYLSKMQPSDVISGIYKINYPNGKAYIGQAQNIRARLMEHNSYAKVGHGLRELLLCEQKMKQYNFFIEEFELLEQINDLNLLDEKEKYWIAYYHTYIKEGQGYNKTRGGDASGKKGIDNANAAFNQQQLDEIIDLLQNHTELSLIDIANKYHVEQNTILKISTGKTYVNPTLNYPLRRNNHDSVIKNNILDYFSSEEELLSLKDDLLYRWDLSIEQDILKKYNIPLKILRDINNGRKFENIGNYKYPIRAKNVRNTHNMTQDTIKNILNLLRNSDMTMIEIGDKYNFGRDAIRKINNGESYLIKDYDYPARKTK